MLKPVRWSKLSKSNLLGWDDAKNAKNGLKIRFDFFVERFKIHVIACFYTYTIIYGYWKENQMDLWFFYVFLQKQGEGGKLYMWIKKKRCEIEKTWPNRKWLLAYISTRIIVQSS